MRTEPFNNAPLTSSKSDLTQIPPSIFRGGGLDVFQEKQCRRTLVSFSVITSTTANRAFIFSHIIISRAPNVHGQMALMWRDDFLYKEMDDFGMFDVKNAVTRKQIWMLE